MQKENKIVKESKLYEIIFSANEIACVKFLDGKVGIINLNTGAIIVEPNNYENYYEKHGFIYLRDVLNTDDGIIKYVTIYDIFSKNMIANHEKIKYFFNDNMMMLKTLSDEKLHLFDGLAYRNHTDIFNRPLDGVYTSLWPDYLIVSANGKYGMAIA